MKLVVASDKIYKTIKAWEDYILGNNGRKCLMEHFNIGEFNKGQSSKLIKKVVDSDSAAFIQKNGKPIAVVMSYDRYERLFKQGIDINEY